MNFGQDMMNFHRQTELLCLNAGSKSPSTAVLLEILCKEKKFKRRFNQHLAKRMSQIVANEVFENDFEAACEEDSFIGDGMGCDDSWGDR